MNLPGGDEADVELIKNSADSSNTYANSWTKKLQSGSHSSCPEHIQTFKLLILFPSWAPMRGKLKDTDFTVYCKFHLKYDTLIQ